MKKEHPNANRDELSQRITEEAAIHKYKLQVRGRQLAARNIIPHVTLHGIEHKSCCKCGRLKPVDKFGKKTVTIDGLANRCIECAKSSKK